MDSSPGVIHRPAEARREGWAAPDIAVVIPCLDEAATIAKVVADFRRALPAARVYVYDNGSSDATAAEAHAAGAVVRHESRRGKGMVISRMFADIDADVYVMVDGDGTYDASAAPRMVERLILENVDMVSAVRIAADPSAYRRGHAAGNRFLTGLVGSVFGAASRDMLSGYRALSRRFVKSFPLQSGGFELETELTVHALSLQMPTAEQDTVYRGRSAATESKLDTLSDGMRILLFIGKLLKQERPLQAFGIAGSACLVTALLLAVPVFEVYFQTGLVPRFPTVILSTGLVLVGCLSYTCGFILETVTRGRQEAKRLRYLSIPSPRATLDRTGVAHPGH